MASEPNSFYTSKDLKSLKKDELVQLILNSQNSESLASKSNVGLTTTTSPSTCKSSTDNVLEDTNQSTCRPTMLNLKYFEDILDDKLEKHLRPLEQKITSLIQSNELLRTRCDSLQNEVDKLKKEKQHNMNEMMNEMEQRQLRRMNVIIAGIPESSAENLEERKKFDEREVCNVLRELNAESNDVTSVRRIGRPGSHSSRLLLVRFRNFETRIRALRNAKNLRHSHMYKKVYINKDLTHMQQKEQATLQHEVQERRKKGEDVVIFRNEVKSKQELKNFL